MWGRTPIGLSFIKGGTQIMVADANLNDVAGGYTLALVSTQRALQGSGHGACSASCRGRRGAARGRRGSQAGPCW